MSIRDLIAKFEDETSMIVSSIEIIPLAKTVSGKEIKLIESHVILIG